MFIPDDGCIFVYRDFSQAEARVVAALANDEYLLALFADPRRDVHKETAAAIYGVPVEKVTPEQRYTAKRVRHAVNYGMDAGRFVQVVNEDAEETGIRIDLSTARRVIDGFFLLHPNHKSVYWANIDRELRQTRTLNTAFGRKRQFFGRMDDKLSRDGYSYPPQSAVGDLCCKALVRIYHEIQLARPELEVSLLANVHDSILVQCRADAYKDVAEAMAVCMDIPFTVNGHVVRIPTDCKVGRNWEDVKDIDKWES
jgi:DNA polymerase-1